MENPVLNDDAAGEALRQMGAEMDRTGIDPSSANPEPEARAGTEETKAEQKTTDEANPAPEVKSDSPEPKPEAKADQQQKEPSKFEKAKQREAAAWKKIQDEQAAIARERQALERMRQQVAAGSSKQQKPVLKDERGFSADDYENAAKEFDKDPAAKAMADAARAKASELRGKEAAGQQNASLEKHRSDWQSDMEKVIGARPELGKPDSAESKELAKLLGEEPIFGHIPNGFSKAVQLLDLRKAAAEVPGLKDELSKLKAEVARLNKLTQLGNGNPAAPAGSKKFEDMSEAEMRDQLQRSAALADGF